MDFLTFLKKHYEKVVLSVVLAALAAAAILLLLGVAAERARINATRETSANPGSRPLPVLDLSTNETMISRLNRPGGVQLDGDHNLFNPVTWKKRSDGNLLKIVTGNEVGAGALLITRAAPLMLRVSYEGSAERGSESSHKFKVTREAHRQARKRSPQTREVIGAGARNDVFILREIRPPNEDPQEFVLEMIDEDTSVTVGKDAPYEGVAGYTVDLSYPPDKQVFLNKRVGDKLVFAGDTNVIVAVEESSVTVEAGSNKKRTTIARSAGGNPSGNE
jgi:hypothetical protein